MNLVAKAVSRPGDAWVAARMLGWALALPVLKRALPLPTVVRLCSRRRRAAARDQEREERIATLARRLYARTPVRDANCLERSLLTYRFLTGVGADPVLVVGVAKGETGVIGHAWVTVDGEPVQERADELSRYSPVVSFGPDGERVAG